MTLEQGTYLVVNANSGLALDVCGASKLSGANVQQWTVNRGDAQVWALVPAGDGTWTVACPLSGKVLDVKDGRMADGTNVRQWDPNGSAAQAWAISPDGRTATFGGASRDTYAILSAKDSKFALDVSAGGKRPGTNVQVWTANGSDAQRWMLVPVACMADGGTYAIHPAIADGLALDVSGGSTANGANVQVWSYNRSNAQVWQAVVDPSTREVELVRPDCGRALDVNGGEDRDGANVQQWERNGSPAQRWLLVASGSKEVDGSVRQLYEVRPHAGTNRALDVAGGGRALGTNVQVWGSNGSAAQRFWLEHASYVSTDVPAPTVDGLTPDGGFTITDALGVRGTTNVRVRLYSRTGMVRARYRTVCHAWGDRGSSTTGPWRSLVDGSTANAGWGDGWTGYECGAGPVLLPAEVECPVGEGAADLVEVQVEACGFVASAGSLGASATSQVASATLRVAYAPKAGVASASVTADGVALSVTSDAPTHGNTYVVSALGGEGSSGPAEGAATVTVPWGSLSQMPGDSAVPVTISVVTPDLRSETATEATVSWSTSATLSVSGTSNDPERCVSTVTYATTAARPPRSAVVAWEGDGGVRFEPVAVSGASAEVPYPMGVGSYYVIATCDDGTRMDRFDSPVGRAWVWLWGDGLSRCARMRFNMNGAVSRTREISYSANRQSTNGRRHPMVDAWPVRTLDLSVEGMVPVREGSMPLPGTSDRGGMVALSEALGQGWHPVFRSPDGDWERVAVTSVSLPQEDPRWCRCTVKQEAVSEDA